MESEVVAIPGVHEGLPQGWRWLPLAEVADNLDNKRKPINAAERETRKGDVPYYGATGQVGWIDKHLLDEEVVLVGEDGAPFLEPGRPKAYMISGKSWVNNHAHILRARDGMPNAYLMHFLNILDYSPYVTGTTRLKLTKGAMNKIPVPVAPLPQQRRIVEAIELQLGRLDAAVARLHAAKARLKRYKQAVLKAAVEEAGEDPNAETVVLADVADLCLGKMLDRQKNKGTPHPYLRNINVRWGAFETEDLHQMPFGDHEHERYGLEVGDLVMCEGGEPGRCAVWDGSIPDMKIQKALHRIRCNTSTDPHFVMFNVLSAAWLGTIDKYYTGTTIKHLTGKMLARFELVLPPIKVQRRLVMRIQEAFERTEEMESTLDAQLAHSTRLRQSVLKRAFQGRLV